MRLAANLSTQFADGPWPSRAARAAAAGFSAIEAQWPYHECNGTELGEALRKSELDPVLINAPVGRDEAARFGFAAIPERRNDFRRSIRAALDYADAVGFSHIHVLAGAGGERQVLLDNLADASELAGKRAILVIEAINRQDVPNYHLAGIEDAVSVLRTLNCGNLRLMFDFYHAHRAGDPIVPSIADHSSWISHVQISDHPGRGEPGSGEVDFRAGLGALRRAGYAGAVGCEFRPTGKAEDCLLWTNGLGFDLAAGGRLKG